MCAKRRGTTVLWHTIFIKRFDELSVRGKESKFRDLDTPSVCCSLCVRERCISFMFLRLSTDYLVIVIYCYCQVGLMSEGAASFLNLCFIEKNRSSSDFALFMFLDLLMLIKRPEAVKMLFLKLIPF